MHLQAKGRSGSDTSKLSCCTRRSYIFRIFSRYNCLLHTSINYTENVRIFTRMRKQWIPGALLRFFKRLGTRLHWGWLLLQKPKNTHEKQNPYTSEQWLVALSSDGLYFHLPIAKYASFLDFAADDAGNHNS